MFKLVLFIVQVHRFISNNTAQLNMLPRHACMKPMNSQQYTFPKYVLKLQSVKKKLKKTNKKIKKQISAPGEE